MQAYAPILQLVRQLHGGHYDAMSDGELLRQFLTEPEQATFAALVRRHGAMVFHVCRRVLGRSHDVEDAFQATFLVLVQKARQLQHRETVGDWLHGVAHNVALKARAMITRRTTKERAAVKPVEVLPATESESWQRILDEEIRRLPLRYRQALILCDLEQKTRKESAQLLGWREGTVASRLARGRSMLCKRLKGRGVEITALLLGAEMACATQATTWPAAWMQSITQAACELAGGATVISAASVHVATLIKAGLASSIPLKAVVIIAALGIAVGIMGRGWPPSVESPVQAQVSPITTQAGVSIPAQAATESPRRHMVASPARSDEMILAKIGQVPLLQRTVQGTDEEALLDLGLSDEQLADFLNVRDILRTQTQEMHKLTRGHKERGLEINRDWNASLMQIMTPEQYLRYCQYWDERQFRASR